MKTSTSCAPQTCDSAIAERPRYFPRQIITADDLSLDQEYARNARRLHNRMLHGWGVVCGAKVCPVPDTTGGGQGYQPWQVSVCPGYILGPCGDEILIDCCKTVDLRTSGTNAATGDPCVQMPDPWCSDVFTKPVPTGPLYVAVKYKQIMARPVRVQPVGCGCDDTSCEYSRWRDGYEIGVLQNYQCSQTAPDLDAAGNPDLNLLVRGDMIDCPTLPKDPWVVLAVVNVDANGTIQSIDNCACRRWVVSFGNFWWACHSTQVVIQNFVSNAGVDFQNLKPDSKTPLTAKVHISAGTLAQPPASAASLGQGITIKNFQVAAPTVAGQDVTLTFVVESDTQPAALPGFRNLTLKNVDCSIAIFPSAIQVVADAAPPAKAPVKKKVK